MPGATLVSAVAGPSKDNAGVHGMQAQMPYQTRDNVAMVTAHGVISRPLPGAKMVILQQDGDPSRSVCLGTHDPRYHSAGLPDGCVGLAHHLGASILFYADRVEIQAGGRPVRILDAGDVDIQTATRVRIVGDLEVTGEIKARADGAAITVGQHTHTDSRGGATSVPNG